MNKLARLEKVDLRDQWKDEAKDFTPWLAEPENIEILSEAIGMELEVIGKEEKVGSFSADILCKDINTNRNVVIENQLEQQTILISDRLLPIAPVLKHLLLSGFPLRSGKSIVLQLTGSMPSRVTIISK